jgi:hypothetical protein
MRVAREFVRFSDHCHISLSFARHRRKDVRKGSRRSIHTVDDTLGAHKGKLSIFKK